MQLQVPYIRQLKQSGKPAFNAFITSPSVWAAEIVASNPLFNCITIDLQHGLMDWKETLNTIQMLQHYKMDILVRVPSNESAAIMKALDFGATGIICAMINTKEDCEKFVQAAKYPPDGFRSYGPIRPAMLFGDTYRKQANDFCLTFAMIETKEAVDNIDEIASVKGLSGIYMGPSDLSMVYGFEKIPDYENIKMQTAINQFLLASQKHDLISAIQVYELQQAQRMINIGFSIVTVFNDSLFLKNKIDAFADEINAKLFEPR